MCSAEAGLLNKSSFLATALDVTKFRIVTDILWPHFFVLHKLDLRGLYKPMSVVCWFKITKSYGAVFTTPNFIRNLCMVSKR